MSLFADIFQIILPRFKVFAFTFRILGVSVDASDQKLKIEYTFILILSYDFPSYRSDNTCKEFLIFRYFISYELILKIAFYGHFVEPC